ncbi:hypothetical protein SAMN04488502_104202 [Dendrosporobacter quercicolus]|uniref:Nitroreductase family protein n=1 Tax=Dendrosporobacter quercicolus TaxID=146817 RepID=A0A1G9T3H6_9FIRM|nr:hypothetical protein SAMN04488502_104202 [Dendrosporobacter quercicolus]
MDFLELAKARYSVRKFTKQQVETKKRTGFWKLAALLQPQ